VAVPASLLGRLPPEVDASATRAAAGRAEEGSLLSPPVVEQVPLAALRGEALPAPVAGPLRVEYTVSEALSARLRRVLARARTRRGHVVVLDPRDGRVLAYVSAGADALPAGRAYPAASLAKVVTAAAVLEQAPEATHRSCRYRGSPYRLTRARLEPARHGNEASFARALAGSYNQCFAQLAVHALGADRTRAAFERFGWDRPPAPGHEAGRIAEATDDYALGKLGSGLAPTRITVLHAAQLAGSLLDGRIREPWWIERVVDANGRRLALPPRPAPRRVMPLAVAQELRALLVRTTTRGTARRAFRTRRGHPRLGEVRVAGKTGNLSGSDPRARYEWFAGVAPATQPRVAVAVLQAHGHLWWRTSAQIAADVLAEIFCERRRCSADGLDRFAPEVAVAAGAPDAAAAHPPADRL